MAYDTLGIGNIAFMNAFNKAMKESQWNNAAEFKGSEKPDFSATVEYASGPGKVRTDSPSYERSPLPDNLKKKATIGNSDAEIDAWLASQGVYVTDENGKPVKHIIFQHIGMTGEQARNRARQILRQRGDLIESGQPDAKPNDKEKPTTVATPATTPAAAPATPATPATATPPATLPTPTIDPSQQMPNPMVNPTIPGVPAGASGGAAGALASALNPVPMTPLLPVDMDKYHAMLMQMQQGAANTPSPIGPPSRYDSMTDSQLRNEMIPWQQQGQQGQNSNPMGGAQQLMTALLGQQQQQQEVQNQARQAVAALAGSGVNMTSPTAQQLAQRLAAIPPETISAISSMMSKYVSNSAQAEQLWNQMLDVMEGA